MKSIFPRNIDGKGRLVRGCGALLLLVGAGFAFNLDPRLGWVLIAAGSFVAFEALRGWCALRACGNRTKL